MKRLFTFIKYAVLLFVIGLAAGLLNNNFGDSDYSKADTTASFTRSVDWLEANREQILQDHNSMLWWMLIQAAEVSNDARLNALVNEFKSRYANDYRSSMWSYLITGEQSLRSLDPSVENLPDYNIYFIYGYSCNVYLASLPIVQIQNETDFCWTQHPVSPACTTHQLMGYRFMQRTQCNDLTDLTDRIDTVSNYIRYQSMLDFRVVDVYLQRVLMQYDSGYTDRVNPRWVKRILAHQRDDGGWADFETLIPLPGDYALGFSARIIDIRKPQSSFHATAQGVWLMTLLSH
jgi:hypothetical protein